MKGKEKLSLYQFHSKIAKHFFCSICGIYTHHNPRSNPAMTGFNVGCIDEIDVFKFENPIFPYKYPALFSVSIAFIITWISSIVDKSDNSRIEIEK